MQRTNVARALRVAKLTALALLSLIVVYAAAGVIGGLIPVNGGRRPPSQGVTIYVESNGIHTGLVLPKVAAGVDWRPRVPAADLRDPRFAAFDHVVFGWGERTFYLETPTWADVRPRVVLAAAIGSDRTLMHVEHVPRPHSGEDIRAIVLRPAEYRALARYIAAGFGPPSDAIPGYGPSDVFYEARGRYDGLRTCNAWTGAALAHAGVRVGAWTPFPATVMRWF